MRIKTVRDLARSRFKPSVVALEERCTPTVLSLSVAGFVPGKGGANTVSINGFVNDSNSTSASSLSVNYTISDSQGTVLAAGPLAVSPTSPGSLSFSYATTVPRSVGPGNIETIKVLATDADSMGVPNTATANLYVSTVKGVSTLGFGLTAINGDLFGGSAQGRITATQSPTIGLIAKGKGSFQLGSNPNNKALLNVTANGQFQVGIDPQGDMSLRNTRGKANFKVGSYAGGPLADGGLGGYVTGNFSLTRFTDTSLIVQEQGSAYLALQVGGSTTTTATANTITAYSRKTAVNINRDSSGQLRFSLSGSTTVNGDFNPTS